MNQTEIMLNGEGDAWLDRNRAELGKVDRVSEIIEDMGLCPTELLEVGASNGWRLRKLIDKYGCSAIGVDPSKKARQEAREKHAVTVRWGTAEALPTLSGWADMIIYGFCLYLTEPGDWFKIASESSRVLKNRGTIVIHDFWGREELRAVPYRHHKDVSSFHYDFASIWLAHPHYSLLRRQIFAEEDQMVTVLRRAG